MLLIILSTTFFEYWVNRRNTKNEPEEKFSVLKNSSLREGHCDQAFLHKK